MINIKPLIASALVGDDPLVILLGGEYIYRASPPINPPDKLIVYGELDNQPLASGDERELASEIMIQVDCWAEPSTTEIAQAVDRVMTTLGGERQRAPDDDEQSLPCRILVYKFVVDETGEIL